MERFINRETGIILEPSTRDIADNLRKDKRYVAVRAEKPPEKKSGKKPKETGK